MSAHITVRVDRLTSYRSQGVSGLNTTSSECCADANGKIRD
jgi:hypothetical protein